MPEADMITFGLSIKLICLESSLPVEIFSPGNTSGLIPELTSFKAASSKQPFMFFVNTLVASIASGLSRYTSKSAYSGRRFCSLISRIKYRSSWVRPTAKDGITTLPPLSKVSLTIRVNVPI